MNNKADRQLNYILKKNPLPDADVIEALQDALKEAEKDKFDSVIVVALNVERGFRIFATISPMDAIAHLEVAKSIVLHRFSDVEDDEL